MKSPLEDTIWGASYGSVAAVQAAFDRLGPEYHQAILASGAPAGAAQALMPHLAPDAQGIDFGCGSGALGLALRAAGLRAPLDGVDLSPVMLDLARGSDGCYRLLLQANLLLPGNVPKLEPYDFAVTDGSDGRLRSLLYCPAAHRVMRAPRRLHRLRGRATQHTKPRP